MPPFFSSRRDHRTAGRRFTLACAALAIVIPARAAPQTTGLDNQVRATWTRVPLRDWAGHASKLAGLPVIVDRRLDPDVTVTITTDGDTLRSLLDRVAASADGVVEPLAATVRIVPKAVAGRATAAEAARETAVRRLPASMKRRLEPRTSWDWPKASTPRDLVGGLASEASLPLLGIGRIPHDHLPAGSLPGLTVAERIDLVLAQYDLRVAWTPQGGAIVPIDEGVDPPAIAPPSVRAPPANARPTAGSDVYSLRVEAPLDVALAAVAKQLGLALSLDRASLAAKGIAAGEIIRVDVRDLDRDALLDALVAPLGLSWSVDGATLRVFSESTETSSGPTP
jgi:hypothetical protein